MKAVVLAVLSLAAGLAMADPAVQAPMRDPWVPPAVRAAAEAAAPKRSTALSAAQLGESKLRANFDAADTTHSGRLTREQARAGGLGYIVNAFDRIDVAKQGSVSFDDVKRYLRSRGAAI